MKALLKVDIGDWTWSESAKIKAGTEISVKRLDNPEVLHEYMATVVVNGKCLAFGIDFYEFDPIN